MRCEVDRTVDIDMDGRHYRVRFYGALYSIRKVIGDLEIIPSPAERERVSVELTRCAPHHPTKE